MSTPLHYSLKVFGCASHQKNYTSRSQKTVYELLWYRSIFVEETTFLDVHCGCPIFSQHYMHTSNATAKCSISQLAFNRPQRPPRKTSRTVGVILFTEWMPSWCQITGGNVYILNTKYHKKTFIFANLPRCPMDGFAKKNQPWQFSAIF